MPHRKLTNAQQQPPHHLLSQGNSNPNNSNGVVTSSGLGPTRVIHHSCFGGVGLALPPHLPQGVSSASASLASASGGSVAGYFSQSPQSRSFTPTTNNVLHLTAPFAPPQFPHYPASSGSAAHSPVGHGLGCSAASPFSSVSGLSALNTTMNSAGAIIASTTSPFGGSIVSSANSCAAGVTPNSGYLPHVHNAPPFPHGGSGGFVGMRSPLNGGLITRSSANGSCTSNGTNNMFPIPRPNFHSSACSSANSSYTPGGGSSGYNGHSQAHFVASNPPPQVGGGYGKAVSASSSTTMSSLNGLALPPGMACMAPPAARRYPPQNLHSFVELPFHHRRPPLDYCQQPGQVDGPLSIGPNTNSHHPPGPGSGYQPHTSRGFSSSASSEVTIPFRPPHHQRHCNPNAGFNSSNSGSVGYRQSSHPPSVVVGVHANNGPSSGGGSSGEVNLVVLPPGHQRHQGQPPEFHHHQQQQPHRPMLLQEQLQHSCELCHTENEPQLDAVAPHSPYPQPYIPNDLILLHRQFAAAVTGFIETKILTLQETAHEAAIELHPQYSIFASSVPPSIPLGEYISRLLDFAEILPSCYIIGLSLLERLKRRCTVTVYSVHRTFLACLILAIKFHQESFRPLAFYASVSGVLPQELRSAEVAALGLIEYNCFVDEKDYRAVLLDMRRHHNRQQLADIRAAAASQSVSASASASFADDILPIDYAGAAGGLRTGPGYGSVDSLCYDEARQPHHRNLTVLLAMDHTDCDEDHRAVELELPSEVSWDLLLPTMV
jgi:hypothetical protein